MADEDTAPGESADIPTQLRRRRTPRRSTPSRRDKDALWPAAGAVLHHSVGAWPLPINDKTTVKASAPGKSIELIARAGT